MRINLIVARAKNGAIGKNNQMPWHLPQDLKRFKCLTMGSPMLMGRKTYESIGKPLPGRTSIVLSRGGFEVPEGHFSVKSIEEALEVAASLEAPEFFIIGGQQIYEQLLPRAERLFLTEIDLSPEADAFFPELAPEAWTLTQEERHEANSEKGTPGYAFLDFERK